jgi:hypothetical protein
MEAKMKMMLLTYLEGDEECVERLLRTLGVQMYSQISMEGHGTGSTAGWYGETAPYRSRMVFSFMSEAQATRVLDEVRSCTGVEDPRHPIRAFELDVTRTSACGCADDEQDNL